MTGGAGENDAEDVRPSTRTTTPPSPPPSSPAQPTSLGRRLLGSIRAALASSHPAPPPAAPKPKVGLALLLHLSPDHPRVHPAPSASPSPFASASEEDQDEGAAAARPHAGSHSPGRIGGAAATSAPANSMFRQWNARSAPHLLQHLSPAADVAVGGDQEAGLALVDGHGPQDDRFRASDVSGPSEEENLAGDEGKVGEQHGAVHAHGQGAALVKGADAAGDDQEEKVRTGDQLRVDRVRDGDQELRDGTTCCGIVAEDDQEKVEGRATGELGSAENGDDEDAVEDQEAVESGVVDREGEGADGAAVDDQEKGVHQCDTRDLGKTENDGDDAEDNDQEAVEQGVIETAMDNDNAVKDHEVVGQSVIAGIEMHATIDVQDQHMGVDATVLSPEVVSVNSSDRGVGKKVKLPYRQRPGKLNCPSYMSKGRCSYRFSCQLHHPPLKAKPDGSWCPSEQGNHRVADILELNRIGLPIRKRARNCTYYMRDGACRYGKRCHFNHPEYVIDAQFHAPTGWEDSTLELEKSSDHITTLDHTSHLKRSSHDATLDDTSYSKKSSDHATLYDMSYSKKSSDHIAIDDTSSSSEVLQPNILRMLLPPQNALPGTEEMVMQVKKDSNWSSASDDSDSCCSADSSDGPLCKQEHVDSSDGPLCRQEHVDYPERPCRSECPFYKRSSDCKFSSACNCHHPKDKYPVRYHPEIPSLGGEQTEYPERPGEPECPFYMKNRSCRFMEKCRFDHPKDSNPTTESPRNGKKYVATDEHHQSTRITLDDHLPQQQQYPERPGQPDCRYYLQYGKCKFLTSCIFHHPRDGLPVGWNPSGPAYSDQIGPQIHGMPECPFYMKSGKCQFGSACEFRHPKGICLTTEGAFGHRTDLANDNIRRPENVVQKQEQTMYPERPGEPWCFDYMRHGFCRFRMNCKYHHPADQLSRKQYDLPYH